MDSAPSAQPSTYLPERRQQVFEFVFGALSSDASGNETFAQIKGLDVLKCEIEQQSEATSEHAAPSESLSRGSQAMSGRWHPPLITNEWPA